MNICLYKYQLFFLLLCILYLDEKFSLKKIDLKNKLFLEKKWRRKFLLIELCLFFFFLDNLITKDGIEDFSKILPQSKLTYLDLYSNSYIFFSIFFNHASSGKDEKACLSGLINQK